MTLTIADLLAGTNATALVVGADGSASPAAFSPADLERNCGEVVVDSRQVGEGGVFVALPGERVDGHEFVRQALAAGASCALVSRIPEPEALVGIAGASAPLLFQVQDTLRALGQLAKFWRLRMGCEVVGITGSVGKTTTKEIVAAVLGRRRAVLKTEANLNTEVGLPLTLLRLRPEHEIAVLEMGMFVPGDIAALAAIAVPRIGIVTNVGPIHLERVGSIARIARGKSELVAALPADGLAVLNGDDLWTRSMATTSGIAPSVLCGTGEDCDYRLLEVEARGLEGTTFTVLAEGRRVTFRSHVPGAHTAFAFVSAVATARFVGMGWEELQEGVADVRLEARQRILRESDGLLIIDDSYNAAPMSVKAALELLRSVPGTKIAVLGDMLELGSYEESAHREVGARAAQVADWLVVRGERASWTAEAAVAEGLPPDHVLRTASNSEAVDAVREIVSTVCAEPASSPCAILVKGSRGMKMEEVVQGLRGEA